MPEPLEQPLILDISGALGSIEQLDQALQEAVANFSASLTAAVQNLAEVPPLAIEPDTTALEAGIAAAVDAPVPPVDVEGDATGLADSIDAATAVAPILPVEGDTADLEQAIAAATAIAPIVPVDADVSAAEAAISGLAGEQVSVEVDADTSSAEASLADLSGAASGTTHSVGDLGAATEGFAAAAALGRGEASGLTDATHVLGGTAGQLGIALAAGTATLGFFFHGALNAQAAVLRLDQSMGPLADRIEHLKVGNLTTDLDKLALSLGSDQFALRNIAATFFNFQKGAGTSEIAASKFSETVLALSARAVALNPALGKVEDVAGRLGNVLGRGGRFAANFGISLASTEIKARAAENAARGVGDGVSFASLQLAGGQLALEKYGSHLQEDIARGTENPIIKLEALKQKFEEATIAIGAPLVAPIFDVLTNLEPLAEGVGQALGALGQTAIPVIQGFLTILGPIGPALTAFADGLQVIDNFIGDIPGPVIAVTEALVLLGAAALGAADGLIAAGIAFATNPIGAAALAIGGAAIAFGLLHDKTKEVVADTSALGSAFDSSGDSAKTLASTIGGLNKAIDDYLKKNLAVEKNGTTGAETANELGLSYRQIANAIGGTDADYKRFIANVQAATVVNGEQSDAVIHFLEIVQRGANVLQANARDQLDLAVGAGVLSKNQREAADATFAVAGAMDQHGHQIVDNVAELRALAPLIDEQTRATNASAAAHVKALPAYAALVEKLATGQITVDTFASSIEAFGFTTEGAADKAKELDATLSSFGKSVAAALPDAKTAFDSFTQTIKDDMAAVEEATSSGKGNVHDLFSQLIADSDPAKFTENLQKQVTAIIGFEGSLAFLAAHGGQALADFFATIGPEGAAQLAAGFVSDPSKIAAANGALALLAQAENSVTLTAEQRKAVFEAAGGILGVHFTTGMATGVTQGAPAVGEAVHGAAVAISDRFDPSFSHRVSVAMQAAALALAADATVNEAAGRKGVQAVAAFEAQFGPLSTAQAVKVALAAAGVAATNDTSVPKGAKTAGDKTQAAFKPDLAGQTRAALTAAETPMGQIGHLTTAAGTAGHSVGIGFLSGFAQGLADPIAVRAVANAAASAVDAAKIAAQAKAESQSPSKVAMRIGRDWTTGLAIGISDASAVTNATEILVGALGDTAANSLASVGGQITSSIIDGFNDPATIATAVSTLQELVAKATATAASGQVSQFVSSASGALTSVGTDISNFGSTFNAALQTNATALTAYHAAYRVYIDDKERIPHLLEQEENATKRLTRAQVDLVNAAAAGASKDTIRDLNRVVAEAQRNLDRVESSLGKFRTKFGEDQQAIGQATHDLSDAQRALAAASNPEQFIRNLNRQTAANRAFQADIRKLAAEGFTDLAKQLAQAGPEAAGKLASGLADNRAQAKAAEAAIDAAAAFGTHYTDFLTNTFTPEAAKIATNTGIVIGGAISSGVVTTTAGAADAALVQIRSKLGAISVAPKIALDTSAINVGVSSLSPSAQIHLIPTIDTLAPVTFPATSLEVIPEVVLPLPPLEPLHVTVIPHLEPLPAVTVPAVQTEQLVVAGSAGSPGGFVGPSTIELDLDITLPDGQAFTAQATVPVPPTSPAGKQILAAQVAAKVKA